MYSFYKYKVRRLQYSYWVLAWCLSKNKNNYVQQQFGYKMEPFYAYLLGRLWPLAWPWWPLKRPLLSWNLFCITLKLIHSMWNCCWPRIGEEMTCLNGWRCLRRQLAPSYHHPPRTCNYKNWVVSWLPSWIKNQLILPDWSHTRRLLFS